MIKILVADDHAIIREGVKRILAVTADMVVAGEATSGRESYEYRQINGEHTNTHGRSL